MATYLLAWNPKRWHWPDLAEMSGAVNAGHTVSIRWSCGNSRRLREGDRAFLIRLGEEPRGILAAGTITCDSYEDLHWDDSRAARGETTFYVELRLQTLLDPESDPLLPRELLGEPPLAGMHWDTRMSGIRIPDGIAAELERIWTYFAITRSSPLSD